RKTGKRITHIERAAVSVTGTIQPGTIRRCLTPEYFESGLPARILFSMPDSPPRRWSEAVVSPAIEQAMDGLFESLLGLQMDAQLDDNGEEYHVPVLVPLSPEAKALWVEFYDGHAEEQEQLADDRESSAWSKLEAYAARFALIFSLCRDPNATTVDGQSMADGIRLTRWFCNETRRVYAMLAESPAQSQENALVSLIRDRFSGTVTPRELTRISRKYQPTQKAEAALQELVNSGYGKWDVLVPDTGPGRPSQAFTLNGCRHVDSRQNSPNSKENGNCVNVNTVNTPRNDIVATPQAGPTPPDPDGIPPHILQADAGQELARQAEAGQEAF
ncbi:MAG: DUF3987 domain-containing protein, partial [Phycisphaerae bacterium]